MQLRRYSFIDSMFWNIATYFSIIIESSSTAPVAAPAVDASPGTAAYALFRCVAATASLPVLLYASARINSFSAKVTFGTDAVSAKRGGWHAKFDTESGGGGVLKSSPPYPAKA